MTDENADACVLEIRTYRLTPGAGVEFGRLFSEEAAPLLTRAGIDVVWFGASLDDPDMFALIRAFPSAEERERQEDDFYGSDEWREGPRESVLALIVTYHTVVLATSQGAVDLLRQTPATRAAL